MQARTVLSFILVTLLLVGCEQRGGLGFLQTPEQAQNTQTVFVATNRARTVDGGFGKTRSYRVSYANYDVSIPPTHTVGNLEWPTGGVDPQQDIGVARYTHLENAQLFKARINSAFSNPAALSAGKRVAHVFVHGYNNNFAESLYRVAQLKHDYEEASPAVLYSWPSAAQARLYTYDRDSVLFARDGLVELLTVLAASDIDQFSLTAHSMGSQLLMEALRQIYLHGDKKIQAKIQSVTLISPDIDVDLFNIQVAQLSPLPKPFLVLGSSNDRILRFSSWLSGEPKRVGNSFGSQKIQNRDIEFFDLSKFSDGDVGNHFLLATSPTLLALIKKSAGQLETLADVFKADR